MKQILSLLIICLTSASAFANFQSDLLNAKRSKKESSQWTLTDWLSQKSRMAFWDQWLAMNRQATMYEINASASHSRFKLKDTNSSNVTTSIDGESQNYNLDIYVSIFNVFGEYEKTDTDREAFGGGVGLRLFGTSSQTTNLTVRYGYRKLTDLPTAEYWENQFAEGALQLYLVKFMGLGGKYRMYFPGKSNLGSSLEGTRATGGVFFEMLLFRIFADYYQEPIVYKDAAGVISKQQREGYDAGVRFYF